MKRLALVAVLAMATAGLAHPGSAAEKHAKAAPAKPGCPSAQTAEAEQAIRYMTEVMVASSACQNTTYREFALRNRDAIIAYQKVMASHMHGNAAFDKWNTALANQMAQRQASVPPGQFCQQSEPLMKQASAFEPQGFRAYAAQAAATQTAACGK